MKEVYTTTVVQIAQLRERQTEDLEVLSSILGLGIADPGRAHVAKLYGSAMTEEARRLLAEGYEQSKASAASRDLDATSLVRDASTKIGYISPDLLPDTRTLNTMFKSPAAYIDFSNFDESYAGAASKQRIRSTTDGKVVVTLEDDNDDQGKDALHPRFSMGRWMMQFTRYATALMVVDSDCASNCSVLWRYQLEVGYLADESSCRDAIETDVKYRKCISKKVLSGTPLWKCFTEDIFRSFFDRALSEATGRKAYKELTMPHRGSKGKGPGKGGKGSVKGGKGKGRKGGYPDWNSNDAPYWNNWWSGKSQNGKRGLESQPHVIPPKKTKSE